MGWDGLGWSGTAQSRRLNQGLLHTPHQHVTCHLLSFSSGGTGNSSKQLWMPGETITPNSLGPLEMEKNHLMDPLGCETKNLGCESRVITVSNCQKEEVTVYCAGAAEPETDKVIFFFLNTVHSDGRYFIGQAVWNFVLSEFSRNDVVFLVYKMTVIKYWFGPNYMLAVV